MRELEFLPAWYPQMRRRRRMVVLQSYLMVAVIAGLGFWISLVHRNIRVASALENYLNTESSATNQKLSHKDKLKQELAKLQEQVKVFDKLGVHVDSARLVRAIDQAMPPEMSLNSLTMDVDSSLPMPSDGLRSFQSGGDAQVVHRLNVHVWGVAPNDVAVGNFMSQLSKYSFIDQVAMPSSKERHDSGRLMREFEVTFKIDLDVPMGP